MIYISEPNIYKNITTRLISIVSKPILIVVVVVVIDVVVVKKKLDLSLKFVKNWLSNSWDIPDMDECCQDNADWTNINYGKDPW